MLPKLLDPRPYLADLHDPRRETRNKLHALHDILMIVRCAVLRHNGPPRDSLRRRKLRAAFNDAHRERLILGIPEPTAA